MSLKENQRDRESRKKFEYFTDAELPNGKSVCRLGFSMLPDDIDRPAEYPTQIITTAVDDGSDLARLAQYLAHPDPDNVEYGALSKRTRLVRKIWEVYGNAEL